MRKSDDKEFLNLIIGGMVESHRETFRNLQGVKRCSNHREDFLDRLCKLRENQLLEANLTIAHLEDQLEKVSKRGHQLDWHSAGTIPTQHGCYLTRSPFLGGDYGSYKFPSAYGDAWVKGNREWAKIPGVEYTTPPSNADKSMEVGE